jgi:hypothetical protein
MTPVKKMTPMKSQKITLRLRLLERLEIFLVPKGIPDYTGIYAITVMTFRRTTKIITKTTHGKKTLSVTRQSFNNRSAKAWAKGPR